jgi:hypothetical protein
MREKAKKTVEALQVSEANIVVTLAEALQVFVVNTVMKET